MLFDRFDGAQCQHWQQAETHIGGVHRFHHGERHGARQSLAAIGRISCEPLPAALFEGFVSFAESGRCGDDTVFQCDARLIAAAIDRRERIGGKRTGAFEDGGKRNFVQLRIAFAQRPQVGAGLEREAHVGYGGVV